MAEPATNAEIVDLLREIYVMTMKMYPRLLGHNSLDPMLVRALIEVCGVCDITMERYAVRVKSQTKD